MRPKSPINEFIERSKGKYAVVQKLEDYSVLEFEDGGSDGIYVTECCDNWFYCCLSSEELLQFADFLKELAITMQLERCETEQ